MYRYTLSLVLFIIPFIGIAQSVNLNQPISFSCKNERLGNVLTSINRQYAIPFAYSRDFIPVEQKITINIQNLPLKEALDQLFAPTKIIYALIGNVVVLRLDKSKHIKELPNEEKEEALSTTKSVTAPLVKKKHWNTTLLQKEGFALLVYYHPISSHILDSLSQLAFNSTQYLSSFYQDAPYREMAQVSLVPTVSTNEIPDSITNTFSVNILYGINGGVEGFEVGGLGNNIKNNMKGLQLAGIWNQVDGNVNGTQLAGAFNQNTGYTKGIQLALGVNLTHHTKAIQLAGISNIVKENFAGVQIALISNYVHIHSNGIQIAGFYNKSRGIAYQQFSLGYNKASTVQNKQIGLINVTTLAKGKQIGLVNYSQKTERTPIGLFSYSKTGYNRIEIGGAESLFTNFGFKLGVRKFYNIIQFGYRFTNDTWSLGYGIGSSFQIANRQSLHIEWITSHVNEGNWWTTQTNWLNQWKCSYDWQIGKQSTSLFIGPTFNWLISKIQDEETGLVVGSNLPSYTLLDTNRKNANWKIWFGLMAGMRF